eukprot:CAMPEP_0183542868 /NCGR_PEP_ID=MMETSP0371-20130417/42658_1 /TAXON_ID=268820 /ORGANISM="Peridinium aciculiferum, Strain PAER-2" /LENGTH=130 /DNA_ID=CAMNT_0025744215 /DNA_START=158 /DNA_END=547 /DNA_ORIENTATION=-
MASSPCSRGPHCQAVAPAHRISFSQKERGERHDYAKSRDEGAQSVADDSKAAEHAWEPGSLRMDEASEPRPQVGAGADEQQQHHEQPLEVEERRHRYGPAALGTPAARRGLGLGKLSATEGGRSTLLRLE